MLFYFAQSVVSYSYVSFNKVFFCYRLFVVLFFLLEDVSSSLPLDAWKRLCYFIVALTWPPILSSLIIHHGFVDKTLDMLALVILQTYKY